MPSPRFVPGDWEAASARVVGWFVGTTKVMPFSHSRQPSSSLLFLLHLIPSPLPAVSSSPSLFPLSDGKGGGKGRWMCRRRKRVRASPHVGGGCTADRRLEAIGTTQRRTRDKGKREKEKKEREGEIYKTGGTDVVVEVGVFGTWLCGWVFYSCGKINMLYQRFLLSLSTP